MSSITALRRKATLLTNTRIKEIIHEVVVVKEFFKFDIIFTKAEHINWANKLIGCGYTSGCGCDYCNQTQLYVKHKLEYHRLCKQEDRWFGSFSENPYTLERAVVGNRLENIKKHRNTLKSFLLN